MLIYQNLKYILVFIFLYFKMSQKDSFKTIIIIFFFADNDSFLILIHDFELYKPPEVQIKKGRLVSFNFTNYI